MAGRYYNACLWRYRKRRQFRNARLLLSLSRLYRQCDSYLCRCSTSLEMCRDYEKAGTQRRIGQGKNNAGVQFALQICTSHNRSDCQRNSDKAGLWFARFLLSFLSGACRAKRHSKHCVLLYFNRGIYVPKWSGCRDCCANGQGI